jgi:hypothetical protein
MQTFLYNSNSDFFSFALDRPTDYLLTTVIMGSEVVVFFSQQLILAEVVLNQNWIRLMPINGWPLWMEGIRFGTGLNSWWCWTIEKQKEEFVYVVESDWICLPDYFEMYLPVYSSNGWEMRQDNYNEKNPL